jgi:hypothetical protein
MKRKGMAPQLIAAIVVVAVLCTVLTDHGWAIWLPVLLALAVTMGLGQKVGH